MADDFASYRPGLESPATRHYEITLDSPAPTVLDPKPRALYVAAGGDVEIIDDLGVAVTYTVAEGDIIPFRASSLGDATTASLVAWY